MMLVTMAEERNEPSFPFKLSFLERDTELEWPGIPVEEENAL